jgi:deazaflavin-dependent oxidoreductase (nitroreductase family)
MREKPGNRPASVDVMPLPAWLARFNREVTNRIARPIAGRLPGFAVVSHVGRRSGRSYRTPVNMFRSGDRYVIALTYGRDRDWVKNIRATGSCMVETRGKTLHLADPRLVKDKEGALVPSSIRPILKAIGVAQFMTLAVPPPDPLPAGVIWTVETWRVEDGREAHFLEHCGDLAPDELTLFRDLESPGLFWSPTRWESLAALESWRAGSRYASSLDAVRQDVAEHETYVMAAVEGFSPQRDAQRDDWKRDNTFVPLTTDPWPGPGDSEGERP